MDKLQEMFKIQFKSQETLGTWEKVNESKQNKQEFINQMILACYEEVNEIMRETPYKNPDFVKFGWKKTQLGNNDLMKEEIIDLFHFVMNLFIVSGGNAEEFYEIYKKKNQKNLERWKGDY